jgi:hypothetical protein
VAANARALGGYMTAIPTEWQALLGGPALTGNCCQSIISVTSSGPSATVFNPDDVAVRNPIPGKTVLFYPLSNPLGGCSEQNNFFNCATKLGGVAFPAGSRSVLFIGRQGTGPVCYKGNLAGCPDNGGFNAPPYRHQIWAYDANDFLAVKNGQKQPWELRPYALIVLTDMDTSGEASVGGAVYDSARNLFYVAEAWGETPMVHVYKINVPGATPPPPPSGSRCDIDNSASTNVVDVQLCANQAIGTTACGTGDIDMNGSCNVVDVQRVVNAALGGTCVTP